MSEPICQQCGAAFKPARPSAKQIAAGHVQRFCSTACRGLSARRYDSKAEAKRAEVERARLRAGLPPRPAECKVCAAPLPQSGLRVAYCGDECRRANASAYARQFNAKATEARRTTRLCAECRSPFTPVYGAKLRIYCSEVCGDRAGRRAAKATRRARMRGLEAESFNAIRVFERDGWRCHLCGRMTLASKRGTSHPRAPELDHIVPLALGGAHTQANTACACRACNGAKGARVLGQPSLLICA